MAPSSRFIFFPVKEAVLLCAGFLLGIVGDAGATILSGVVVTGSATAFSPAFAPENTLDNTELEYASAGQGVDTFLEYSLGSRQTFDKIVVINRNSTGQSDYIGNFTLTLDGGPTTVSVTRTPMRGVSQLHSLGTLSATTVRLDVDTIGTGDAFNNTGAMEVFFVRTPPGQTPISASIIGSAPAFSPFFDVSNAIDGDIGRSSAASGDGPEYASAGQGANTFVDFDLGAGARVGGFDFFDRPADEDRVTGFDLILSQNATFGDGDDIVRSYQNSNMALGDVFATAISARYIRFDVTSNLGANTGISEIVFYQVPEPSALGLLVFGIGVTLFRRDAKGWHTI